jgi:hypothetical protein
MGIAVIAAIVFLLLLLVMPRDVAGSGEHALRGRLTRALGAKQ